jgi:hypothetical protein
MIASWTSACVKIFDVLLGWTLGFRSEVTILLVAAFAVAIALLIRWFVTDQASLRRIADDLRKLRQLIRRARSRLDRDAIARHRRVRAAVLGLKLRKELPAAVVSLIPLAALLTWGHRRLDLVPPRAEAFTIRALLPISAEGRLIHLVPEKGLTCPDGWVRKLTLLYAYSMSDPHLEPSHTVAQWSMSAGPETREIDVRIRFGDRTMTHPVLLRSAHYELPRVNHAGIGMTEVLQPLNRPFGIGIGTARLGLYPWLFPFVGLAVVMYLAARRILKIA